MIIKSFRYNALCACYLAFYGITTHAIAQDLTILPNGHSHNDYTRDNPLHDALHYGFTSIEVDVYWHEDRMVVTHDDNNLDEKPSLQELYLDPLRTIIEKNGSSVFKGDDTQLVLMVDLKSEKIETYHALKNIFSSYLEIIEWYKNGEKNHGAIRVLLTGGPPVELIQEASERYFYVDGDVNQWSMNYPVMLMPRASTNYRSYFKWYGNGKMPIKEEQKLRELIQKAHDSGRKVRFWGCPNQVEVWKKLMDEGADWINVDDLEGFYSFYRDYKNLH